MSLGPNSSFKPREIYFAREAQTVWAVALCLPKRGGSTKILLATRTNHLDSLTRLLSKIEQDTLASLNKVRKLYSLVSTLDSSVQKAFYQAGYRPEGVLDRPYRTSDDLLVMSKLLPDP
jgi:hypothetical protein